MSSPYQSIFYEKTGLSKGVHDVIIRIPSDSSLWTCFDAIDIDADGYIISQYDNLNTSNCTYSDRKNPNLGKQLTAPEEGWVRYDDSDTNIKYSGEFAVAGFSSFYNGSYHYIYTNNSNLDN